VTVWGAACSAGDLRRLELVPQALFERRRLAASRTSVQISQVPTEYVRHLVDGRRSFGAKQIDELPQLVNVVLGEMSIVGPRPHPIALNEAFAERISPLSRRHKVKPGITGWAQVNGHRGETDTIEKMQRRIECDLYYVDNWSFLLDIKIIVMTLFSKRAYTNAV
jgi:hypothetical protein